MANPSWDGKSELPAEANWIGRKGYIDFRFTLEDSPDWSMKDAIRLTTFISPRVHPFCTLIRNTDTFRSLAEKIGFSGAVTFERKGGKNWDTMGLITAAMEALGHKYLVSKELVYHFFNVSYEAPWRRETLEKCKAFLECYRRGCIPDQFVS